MKNYVKNFSQTLDKILFDMVISHLLCYALMEHPEIAQ